MVYEILTNEQMAEADRLTIKAGKDGFDLMLTAGKAAADVITEYYAHDYNRALVLCGPGNNGGDGFVIASLLEAMGWIVRLAALRPAKELKGEAAKAAEQWNRDVLDFETVEPKADEIIIDAVFGTGFSGELSPPVSTLFRAINAQKDTPVIAIDIPSGVNGSNGYVTEDTIKTTQTITFHRKKLGHVLMPGMGQCGYITICDIGIDESALDKTGFATIENNPSLWLEHMPRNDIGKNKYDKGHVVILGGPLMTGAARMAADGSMRIGAGLCTIAGHEDAADIYRGGAANIMYKPWTNYDGFYEAIEDKRCNALLIGPGAGLDNAAGLRELIAKVINPSLGKYCVLDADALTAFKGYHESFYSILHEDCILTPHEGEFARIFPQIAKKNKSKLERCQEAAELSDAIILLKGPDTIIAHPDGRTVINTNGTADLATGGSGDVLAGMITGLLAQKVEPFHAACIAAWIHGRASQIIGKGLIAIDIPEAIPQILQEIT